MSFFTYIKERLSNIIAYITQHRILIMEKFSRGPKLLPAPQHTTALPLPTQMNIQVITRQTSAGGVTQQLIHNDIDPRLGDLSYRVVAERSTSISVLDTL